MKTHIPKAPVIAAWRALAAATVALASLPATAQSTGLDAYVTTTFHYVDGNGQHHPSHVCASPSGSCTSAMPYAQAQGTVVLGAANGSTDVTSIGRDGAGSGYINLHWWDTFTIVSATLPMGTPVTLHMELDMTAAVMPSIWAPSPYTRAQASLNYGGPDGPAHVFTSTQSGSSLYSSANLTQAVGQTLALWGNLLMFTDTSWALGPDSGSVAASAVWRIAILEPDAAYSTASGHNYTAAVPEVPTGSLLASGLAVLAWLARARRRA